MNRYLVLIGLLGVFTACFSRQPASLPPVQAEPETVPADPVGVQNRNLQRSIEAEGFSSKGTIQAVTEVPVYSRIGEQIVEFNLVLGQRVRKGQVVVRLNQAVLQDKIARGQAELEKAEFQYQSILMGQGYKRSELEKAPEEIRHQARVNSGYNTAKAALQQLEHELTYCSITAPVTGAVSRIDAALFGP